MKNWINTLSLGVCLGLGVMSGAQAHAPDFVDKLQSDARPAEDKARDGARRPVQVMRELGVEEGWTIVDVLAGAGWYTEVMSAAVGPKGNVISHVGPRALQNGGAMARAAEERAQRLGNVSVLTEDLSDAPEGIADAALTALNLHDAFNFRGEEGAKAYLQDIYNVLKSGGVAAIIDHEGSPEFDNSDLHRMVAADARRMLEAVGFEVLKESNVLHTYADDHSLSIRDASLGRNTDRFLFIVRKP